MLAIKLQRVGKKHQPSFRVVVAEKKSNMAGPPVEDLGSYSVMTKKAHLNAERVKYWIGVGAQPTVTVHNLLVKERIIDAPKVKLVFKVPAAPTVAPPSLEAADGHSEAVVGKQATEDEPVKLAEDVVIETPTTTEEATAPAEPAA